MKYKERYPDIRPVFAGYQENYKDEAIVVDDGIEYSGMHFRCSICSEITPFIDTSYDLFVHICSDECRDELHKNYQEAIKANEMTDLGTIVEAC